MRISDWSSDVCSSDLQQQRPGAFADIDRGHSIGIGAKPEEGGLAKAQDAAVAPDEAEAERQNGVDHIDAEFQQGDQVDHRRQADQDQYTDEIGSASCRERVCKYV